MAIYVDQLVSYGQAAAPGAERHFGGGKRSCHMATDGDLEELHRFAVAIGLRRSWFQNGSTPHYDLTPSRRIVAVRQGAIEVDTRELITRCRPKPPAPPPWAYDDNREGHEGACNVYDSAGNLVAYFGDMEDNSWQDITAGQLCAAAPDLYDALAELVKAQADSLYDSPVSEIPLHLWDAAQAALKKAQGKS